VISQRATGTSVTPDSHPDVISAGGVFVEADRSTQASDHASKFASSIYPGLHQSAGRDPLAERPSHELYE
jgi:hypothetical protein